MTLRPRSLVKLTWRERLHVLRIKFNVLCATFICTIKAVFSKPRPASLRRHAINAQLRSWFSQAGPKLEQGVLDDSDEVYRKWCKKNKVTPVRETLADGTAASWIGSRNAKTVLLYFPGGGYNLPALPSHFGFLGTLVKDLDCNDNLDPQGDGNFAALVLHASVAPFQTYPTQLAQAATILNYMRNALSIRTENIIVGGDSAGGNLALSLLSHILHPHPDETSVHRVDWTADEKLKGVLLISPWMDFTTDDESFQLYQAYDFLTPQLLGRWATTFLADRPADAYNRPARAPPGWWSGVGGIVGDVLQVCGAQEVLKDGQKRFSDAFQADWDGQGRFEAVEVENETHVSCAIDFGAGIKLQKVGMYIRLRDWLKPKVAGDV
ncbi:uncharacterized protein K452DRAFT_316068 [Aplosporella prunicola CBS 121167]|uniref:Alpha/beta hydrolase fold-3 domain-containing protein n=1 Tax=Aplosporella prunicola CBS 121167 TaxID=1176127 RepID=A0A6A6BNC5_9PEZI|nr:uncharacterized protein K452DRAFT_316068 [Aplosporella prunicola CBS 121167]KAF2144923.1 hypothetical protein K452DRAFT_316068 [Aplosporella prunicola CBS 121167]